MHNTNDLNQDGMLNHQDLELLRQIILESPAMLNHLSAAEKALLDINQDGALDYGDITALCQKIVAMEMNGSAPSEKLARLRSKLK